MLLEFFSRTIAFLILVILSPIFFLIILLCILFQGFPVFFNQERVGYHFKIFKIYKFRTMINNTGQLITEPNDNRITFFGKFLRFTKIDEIPQLINIIKGEMRFIGPRPEVVSYFNKSDFSFLNKVKPGISDFASIILRNETKILNRIGGNNPYSQLLPIKLDLAKYYASKKSFFLDLMLVSVTVISILFPNFATKSLLMPIVNLESKKTKDFLVKYDVI